jgi:hypothetical protein
MFAVPDTLDWNSPSMKAPWVGPVEVMLIVEAANVGSIVTVVPTNSSAVIRSVWEVVTLAWKPTPEKVATPLTVVAVTDSTAEPELFRSTVVVPALRVTTCPESVRFEPLLLFLTWTTIASEKFEPTRAALGVAVTANSGP